MRSRVIIAATCIGLMSCSSGDLGRSEAMDLLEKRVETPLAGVPFVDKKPLRQCLEGQGLMVLYMNGARLTNKGLTVFEKIDWPTFSKIEPITFTFLRSPDFKISEITGISNAPQDQTGETKIVEYSAQYDFSSTGLEPETISCMQVSSTTVQGSALLRRYDDGWRIASFTPPTADMVFSRGSIE